jgi:hypothetical protein
VTGFRSPVTIGPRGAFVPEAHQAAECCILEQLRVHAQLSYFPSFLRRVLATRSMHAMLHTAMIRHSRDCIAEIAIGMHIHIYCVVYKSCLCVRMSSATCQFCSSLHAQVVLQWLVSFQACQTPSLAPKSPTWRECSETLVQSKEVQVALLQSMPLQSLAPKSRAWRECSKKLASSKQVLAALLQSMLVPRPGPKSHALRECSKKLVPTRRESYKVYCSR